MLFSVWTKRNEVYVALGRCDEREFYKVLMPTVVSCLVQYFLRIHVSRWLLCCTCLGIVRHAVKEVRCVVSVEARARAVGKEIKVWKLVSLVYRGSRLAGVSW